VAYATVEELAGALGLRLTTENTPPLQACLDAAAIEIDHYIAATNESGPTDPANALANRVNIVRGVEWWKANDAAFGVIGFDQVGSLQAPRDSFHRHRKELLPLKVAFGVA
jgi:hypothetical protein